MIAAIPPRRSSFEIRSLIPGAFTIAAADLRNPLLPDTVSDAATGRSYKRPASATDNQWRYLACIQKSDTNPRGSRTPAVTQFTPDANFAIITESHLGMPSRSKTLVAGLAVEAVKHAGAI